MAGSIIETIRSKTVARRLANPNNRKYERACLARSYDRTPAPAVANPVLSEGSVLSRTGDRPAFADYQTKPLPGLSHQPRDHLPCLEMYVGFSLSLRDVDVFLYKCGNNVSDEFERFRWTGFGPMSRREDQTLAAPSVNGRNGALALVRCCAYPPPNGSSPAPFVCGGRSAAFR